ncbi:MAG: hypothetical protein CDV28_14618 [Candidatus Electronema aureum]|uniref:Uncharacterized protein n=1 Tax=Candidatus Electronema aureum TaxID=2005002 RepID=A0A521FYX6_9BACT|nr:MAG: hypothetical protein CDV28_14618 [Candidatus Electronema aureum]
MIFDHSLNLNNQVKIQVKNPVVELDGDQITIEAADCRSIGGETFLWVRAGKFAG